MSQLHWMWFMNWWWKIIIFLIKLVESGAPCENGWFVKLESFLSEFESDFISLSFVSLSIHWMWGENHWNFPAWNYESNIQAELLNCRDYPPHLCQRLIFTVFTINIFHLCSISKLSPVLFLFLYETTITI